MKRLCCLVAVILGLSVSPAIAQQTSVVDKDTAAIESLDCAYTFGSGDFTWCIGVHGNLKFLKSPSGIDHVEGVNGEGYALCHSGGSYWDVGWGESGWAPPLTPTVGSNSVTIVRSTTDGRFTLTQKWTRDTKERDLTVMMTLKNNGATAVNVQLLRQLSMAIDGSYNNDYYDHSAHAVWARDIRSVAATQLNFGDTHDNWVGTFWLADCSPAYVLTVPGGPGWPISLLRTTWTTINAGGKKTIRVVYRVH